MVLMTPMLPFSTRSQNGLRLRWCVGQANSQALVRHVRAGASILAGRRPLHWGSLATSTSVGKRTVVWIRR